MDKGTLQIAAAVQRTRDACSIRRGAVLLRALPSALSCRALSWRPLEIKTDDEFNDLMGYYYFLPLWNYSTFIEHLETLEKQVKLDKQVQISNI